MTSTNQKIEDRIIELEQQAKDDYLEDTCWTHILEMLDKEEYAELKNLYKLTGDSMHEHMKGDEQ